MTAFVVILRERTTDPSELALYREQAPQARAGHAIESLAAYGPLEILEGPTFEGAAILKFPSVDAAHAWYSSSAYQAARVHRESGSESRMFILQGLEP
ncbi:DUF1330 domain-containing protein [Asticcacaulis sp. ZE23SCel15]|jgi:uncharacterized protein (DUF1330 family)|uniref:DUF1330 domain-containing protein n=1 Tax=Asticcacaulis sp. ZE23SCel15 TaxID=3059027 RepID=UPI00265FD5B1|nr:DUF1330 domain-containing protein [Asticcacaulis sp. ZE23SCel15]WKL56088.1 DUF1330 domain-containing protein [Asticcacaulis sp. ZE23SCel15]